MAGSQRTPLYALTGVRFFAAFMVLMFHLAGPGVGKHNYILNGVVAHGSMGVDLFFVLSGFIIHHVYGQTFGARARKRDYWKFLSFRVARMYPVHVFTMALMFILYWIAVYHYGKTPADADSYSLPAVIHNLLMTHAWFGVGSPNVPAWSISAEWFMYLLYPLVALALYRMTLLLDFIILAACLLAVHYWGETNPLLHIVPEFIFGATLYRINARLGLSPRAGTFGGWIFAIAIILALELHAASQALFVLLSGLLIVSLTSEKDRLGQILARKYYVYLGEISYSLYMIHSFIWSVVKNTCRILIPNADFQNILIVSAAAIASVFAAALVYTVIEVPGRIFIRRMTDPKDSVPAV